MIQRVYERACESSAKAAFVATDDKRIVEAVHGFGGQVIMTSADHESGTDRIYEAALSIGLADDEVVVNVQGDEPLMPAAAIDQVAGLLSGGARMATLMEALKSSEEIFDPNVVKVVADNVGRALYFSRAPIPWSIGDFDHRSADVADLRGWYRHLGIYSYKMRLLKEFVAWPMATLEQTEALEQLRVLANGESIRVAEPHAEIPPGIDTPEDVARVLEALSGEGL